MAQFLPSLYLQNEMKTAMLIAGHKDLSAVSAYATDAV